jgi:hypothetical protein
MNLKLDKFLAVWVNTEYFWFIISFLDQMILRKKTNIKETKAYNRIK